MYHEMTKYFTAFFLESAALIRRISTVHYVINKYHQIIVFGERSTSFNLLSDTILSDSNFPLKLLHVEATYLSGFIFQAGYKKSIILLRY